MLRIIAVVGVALVASSCGGSATNPSAIPDCRGHLHVKPQEIVLACADANFSAARLTWTGWGQATAYAQGLAGYNDCSPSCAAGGYRFYPVVLIADGRQQCSRTTAYARIQYAFIGTSPFPTDAPGAVDPTVAYPCGPAAQTPKTTATGTAAANTSAGGLATSTGAQGCPPAGNYVQDTSRCAKLPPPCKADATNAPCTVRNANGQPSYILMPDGSRHYPNGAVIGPNGQPESP
jgi:hypothetical protein